MPNVLIELEIDYEEAIKQYNWLCRVAEMIRSTDLPDLTDELQGMLNMFDEIWVDIFKTTQIYSNGGKTHDRYMVIFPDETVYLMSHDADMPNGVCYYHVTVDCVTWTTLGDSEMVPVGYTKEASVLSVEPGVRAKIREILADNGMDED